jgi:hypothetical protein
MGRLELQAMLAKRTGYLPEDALHIEVKPSGPKPKKPLRRVSLKKQREDRQIKKAGGDPGHIALEKWFENIAKEEAGDCLCWECGKRVPDAFIRAAAAHIFPKKHFHSVATHPLNYLILPASCCHDRTHKVHSFKKMVIWSEAVDRFLQFRHLLTQKERALKYYTLFLNAAMESFPERFAVTEINLL